jgi:hypothetical protein
MGRGGPHVDASSGDFYPSIPIDDRWSTIHPSISLAEPLRCGIVFVGTEVADL